MQVEVDLFSGRPNPRFTLEPAQAAELLRRIAVLSPLDAAPEFPDNLGYRGLKVHVDEDGPVAEIRISSGTVVVRERPDSQRVFLDQARALERWLVETGATSIEPEVMSVLRQEFAA